MFAEIIPALRLPAGFSVFDYAVPDGMELHEGDLAAIPFRTRLIAGIVRTLKDSTLQRGTIKSVAERVPGVRFDMGLMEWCAAGYGAGLPLTAFTFLPTMPKREDERLRSDIAEEARMSPKVAAERRRIIYKTPAERIAAHRLEIRAASAAGRQTLILVAEEADLRFVANGLHGVADAVTLAGSLGIRAAWESMVRFARGDVPVLIGTRLAALAPAHNLGTIILDREEDPSHKQSDAHPRYDAREIAERRAAAISLVSISETPRLAGVVIPQFPVAARTPTTVDLRGAWRSGERGLISEELLGALRAARQNGKISLLLHNRKGLGGIVFCRDCKEIIRCASCARPMAAERNHLICRNCGAVSDLPLFCRNCSGPNIAIKKLGIARLAADIIRLIPGSTVAEVARRKESESPPPLPHGDVILGTEAVLHWYRNELYDVPVGAVGAILADALWQKSGYLANEEAFAALSTLRNLADAHRAPFIIQTLEPDHRVIQALGNPSAFYRAELDDRQRLGYPPAATLIKLTSRLAPQDARVIRLAEIMRAAGASTTVTSGRSRRWSTLLAVRIPNDDALRMRVLSLVPPEWTVDVNPRSLFD